MTDLRQAAQQALILLDSGNPYHQQLAANMLIKALEQPEQEPVAYYHPHKGFYWAMPTHISAPTIVDVPPMPLYVKWKAAQRPWVGLEIEEVQDSYNSDYQAQTRAVEAKLKERNG